MAGSIIISDFFLFRTSKCQAIAIPVKSQNRIPSYSQTKPSQDSVTTTFVDNSLEEKTDESDICNLKVSSQHVPLYAVPEKHKSKVDEVPNKINNKIYLVTYFVLNALVPIRHQEKFLTLTRGKASYEYAV